MRRAKLFIFPILFSMFVHTLSSAQSEKVDSLNRALKNAGHDTLRCKILNELIENEYNESLWPEYNKQLLNLAEKKMKASSGKLEKFYASFYALALNNFGYLHMTRSEVKKAYHYYNQALKIEELYNNKSGIATVYNNLGYLSRQEGNIQKAIDYYHQALKMQTEVKNKQGIAIAYNNIAFIFDSQNETEKAVNYYQKSLKIHLEIGDKEGAGICYGNIAAILSRYGDPECTSSKTDCKRKGLIKSIEYLKLAIAAHKEIGDKSLLAGSMNHLGGIYFEMGDPLCESDSVTCKQLAEQKALELFTESLRLRKEINDVYGLAQSYSSMGIFMLTKNETDKALDYGLKCMEYAEKSNSPERILDAAKILKLIYEKKQNFKESLKMHELYILMRDSVYNDANKKTTLKKTFQIDYELQAAKDSIANSAKIKEERLQNELKVKQQRYYTYGGLIGFALMLIVAMVSFNAYRNKQKANTVIQRQKTEVENQNLIIEKQKAEVEEKQREIVESITYAKRIQEAILPPENFINQYISSYFIFYKPKDIVAGDFYWAEQMNDLFFIAAADSTGHGVPGALVSVVCSGALNRSVKEFRLTETGKILDKTRVLVLETFEKSNKDVKDGMDISLLCIDKKNEKIYWSGANNSLSYIQNDELIQINADKQPIGKTENPKPFTTREIPYVKGSSFYLYTDGFADQFGGEKGKKFRLKNLNELFTTNHSLPAEQQKELLENTFSSWKGNLEQVDDVCIIGIKI